MSNKIPQIVSVALSTGKKYPVPAMAVIKFIAPSGIDGGLGIKSKNPFNPKTKNIRPKTIRAARVTLLFIYSPSCEVGVVLQNHSK
ncbi:hypothetical protein D3C86_2007830 [compost metagenome]